MSGLRFFYLPNEAVEGDQVGPRRAFEEMRRSGAFSEYMAYSYLVRRRSASTHDAALRELLTAVTEFQPDVIYWQHLNRNYRVTPEFLRTLKSIRSRPKLVWHDADAYGRFIKRIDPVMKIAIAESDAVVLVGLGYLVSEVRKLGNAKILFAPHSVDLERFGSDWVPTRERSFDAVCIANLTCLKRIPFLYMPGGRKRKQLARSFHSALGSRFAVFGGGQGWKGEAYCKGSIAFDQQEKCIRSAWLSVNWGQFDEIPMYSSDRLPISLAAGVPHITNYQGGYEYLFGAVPGLYFVKSPRDALDIAMWLLSLPRERLIEIGDAARGFARKNLSAASVYSDIVSAITEQVVSRPSY